MSEYSAATVVKLIPLWLEAEADYANIKYHGREPGLANPQLSALEGGLQPGGSSHREFGQYLHRFNLYYTQSEGDKRVLLSASQMLGKWVSTGRALLRVVVQDQYGLIQKEADELSINLAEEICLGVNRFPNLDEFDKNSYWTGHIEPQLTEIAEALQIRPLDVLPATVNLFTDQVALMTAFTTKVGLLAQPGVPSNEVSPWSVPIAS